MTYYQIFNKRNMTHAASGICFWEVHIAQYLISCEKFVDHKLFFVFVQCVVCPLVYSIWSRLLLWHCKSFVDIGCSESAYQEKIIWLIKNFVAISCLEWTPKWWQFSYNDLLDNLNLSWWVIEGGNDLMSEWVMLDLYSAISLKQESVSRHVTLLCHIFLIPSQTVVALTL